MNSSRPRAWSVTLVLVASVGIANPARAQESSPGVPAEHRWPGREVTLGIGYGILAAASGPVRSAASTKSLESSSTFTGWMVEATGRRFSSFEYGAFAWSTGGSSDGRGSFAHVLLRFSVEARWLPWGFGRIEPWLGANLGVAAADDYATWDPTDKERAHSVSVARFGDAAGAEAGVRGRLGEFCAFGLRGGVSYMNFPKVTRVVSEPGDPKGDYFVRPTDYARRIWYSVTLSAELTVAD
jgi:hypothetical protein